MATRKKKVTSRQTKSKDKLVASGGKRVSVNLPASVVLRIEQLINLGRAKTATEVILRALERI
jgi:hypothetical protein